MLYINNKEILIMGIVNISKNSFYKNSIINNINEQVISYCDIIDIGAESTHPYSKPITAQEEIELLKPYIKLLKNFNKPISIDTYKSKTAEYAIDQGVDIINDISGGSLDDNMFNIISKSNVYYILGHIQNTPETMQINPQYKDVVLEIYDYFKLNIEKLTNLGFSKEKIILDPCIGFGKNLNHNLEILKNIKKFKELNSPILIGTSRKSMHKELTEVNSDYDMLIATITTNIYSILNGANIIRVHDFKEFKIIKDILNQLK